ncbi:MAG: hypothetical protein AABZ08_13520 [Planctomycetota bacterium]
MAEKKSILLRISPELWEQLNRWAKDDLRSLNAQIEFILREATKRCGRGEEEDDEATSKY